MREVAIVSGAPVYSDKNLSGISGTRLSFTDGSWCDVGTGEVFNNGAGFISIGRAPEGDLARAETKTRGPESYRASALQICNVEADVSVDPYDDTEIVVEVSGSQSQIDSIHVREQDGTLLIEGVGSSRGSAAQSIRIGGSRGGGGISISVGRVSGTIVSMSGGGISVTDGGSKNSVRIKVKVPRGTPTSFSTVHGNLDIGDTEGGLNLSAQGGWDAKVGRVLDTQLHLQGSGNISVARVTGALTVGLQGSGDIVVDDGQITALNATLQGSGDIKVGGTAQTANLTLQGSGDIDVAHVVQRPMQHMLGSGDIRVRRVG